MILVVALCLGVAFVFWKATRKEMAHTFMLKDGNKVTFRGATAGTNTQMHFGPFWERMMARLPGKYGAKGRVNIWTDDGGRDVLVLWFTFDRAPPPDAHI